MRRAFPAPLTHRTTVRVDRHLNSWTIVQSALMVTTRSIHHTDDRARVEATGKIFQSLPMPSLLQSPSQSHRVLMQIHTYVCCMVWMVLHVFGGGFLLRLFDRRGRPQAQRRANRHQAEGRPERADPMHRAGAPCWMGGVGRMLASRQGGDAPGHANRRIAASLHR